MLLIAVAISTAYGGAGGAVAAPEMGNDANTSLYLPFEDTPTGAGGEAPTQASGIAFQTGVRGQGAYFGKGNQLHFESAGNIDALEGTIEFWVRPGWEGSDTTGRIFMVWGFAGGLYLGKDGANNLRLVLNRLGTAPGGEKNVGTSVREWKTGQWHHVTVTYSNTRKQLRLYVDGTLKNESTFTGELPPIKEPTFQLGAERQGTEAEALLDGVRISKVAREPKEIAASYLSSLAISRLIVTPNAATLLPTWSPPVALQAVTSIGTVGFPLAAATWESSNPAVAAYDPAVGKVVTYAPGTAVVTAGANGATASTTLTVKAPVREPDYLPVPESLATPVDDHLFLVPVIVIAYLPLKDEDNLDDAVTGVKATLGEMGEKIDLMNRQVKFGLEEGSRYHGYKDPAAKPSLGYKVIGCVAVYEPMPRSNSRPAGISDKPDYYGIMTRFNVKRLVEQFGVKEFWIWGYHTDDIYPVESNMSSPLTGDVSNSDRLADLPICSKSYIVYNFNYQRTASEALHNYGHQLEHMMAYANRRQDGNSDLWSKQFMGQDEKGKWITGRCGWTHMPPNTTKDYDWLNQEVVESDIEDWTPDGTGQFKPVNVETWARLSYKWPNRQPPPDKTVVNWFIYWRQNIPGRGNKIRYKGGALTNWWQFMGDWDNSITNNKGLYQPAGG